MLDWLWNSLVAPWPDLAVGTLEIRDVMNLLLAAVSAILAALAIKTGWDNDKVTA